MVSQSANTLNADGTFQIMSVVTDIAPSTAIGAYFSFEGTGFNTTDRIYIRRIQMNEGDLVPYRPSYLRVTPWKSATTISQSVSANVDWTGLSYAGNTDTTGTMGSGNSAMATLVKTPSAGSWTVPEFLYLCNYVFGIPANAVIKGIFLLCKLQLV